MWSLLLVASAAIADTSSKSEDFPEIYNETPQNIMRTLSFTTPNIGRTAKAVAREMTKIDINAASQLASEQNKHFSVEDFNNLKNALLDFKPETPVTLDVHFGNEFQMVGISTGGKTIPVPNIKAGRPGFEAIKRAFANSHQMLGGLKVSQAPRGLLPQAMSLEADIVELSLEVDPKYDPVSTAACPQAHLFDGERTLKRMISYAVTLGFMIWGILILAGVHKMESPGRWVLGILMFLGGLLGAYITYKISQCE